MYAIRSYYGNGDGGNVHDKVGHYHNKEGYTHNENKPVGILEHDQPVDRHPFGCAGFPQTEADAHGTCKEQDDIPGNFFQIVNSENADNKEQDGGDQDNGGLVKNLEGRDKRAQGHDHDTGSDDRCGDNLVAGQSYNFV